MPDDQRWSCSSDANPGEQLIIHIIISTKNVKHLSETTPNTDLWKNCLPQTGHWHQKSWGLLHSCILIDIMVLHTYRTCVNLRGKKHK